LLTYIAYTGVGITLMSEGDSNVASDQNIGIRGKGECCKIMVTEFSRLSVIRDLRQNIGD